MTADWLELGDARSVVEAMDNLPCRCGHPYSHHDPEDAECDAGLGLGKCPCRCFQSPDPNLTANEYRLRAALSCTSEKGCETCEGTGQYPDKHDKRFGETCITCSGTGTVRGEPLLIPRGELVQVDRVLLADYLGARRVWHNLAAPLYRLPTQSGSTQP